MTEINFNVPMPEAGEGAIVNFSIEDLEALETELGENYLMVTMKAIANGSPSVIRKALNIGLKGGDADKALNNSVLDNISERVGDAIMLRIKGVKYSDLENADAAT